MNPPLQAGTAAPEVSIDGEMTPSPAIYAESDGGLDFDRPVTDNGYLWWYIDAVSDDGQQAMTLIVFVGSVFSPYYAKARYAKAPKRQKVTAESHCAFNTILYGPGRRKRWSMTERSEARLTRSNDRYELGPSSITWDGDCVEAKISEYGVPVPRRMEGTIRLRPSVITRHQLTLDRRGHHHWRPIAPTAHVEVDFPGLGTRWSGHGYMDSNQGSEPLADGFSGWDWLRVRTPNGDCRVRYEAREENHQPMRLALQLGRDGSLDWEPTSSAGVLPPTRVWQAPQMMPSQEPGMRIERTLEDTPFYSRSLMSWEMDEGVALGMHESLSMTRFVQPWVQRLLPFRMPRLT